MSLASIAFIHPDDTGDVEIIPFNTGIFHTADSQISGELRNGHLVVYGTGSRIDLIGNISPIFQSLTFPEQYKVFVEIMGLRYLGVISPTVFSTVERSTELGSSEKANSESWVFIALSLLN